MARDSAISPDAVVFMGACSAEDCERTVRRPLPPSALAADKSEGRWVRCQCGQINYLRDRETPGGEASA